MKKVMAIFLPLCCGFNFFVPIHGMIVVHKDHLKPSSSFVTKAPQARSIVTDYFADRSKDEMITILLDANARQTSTTSSHGLLGVDTQKCLLLFTMTNKVLLACYQELFNKISRKMGLDQQGLSFKVGEVANSCCIDKHVVHLGKEQLKLPKNETEFVIAHELAHVRDLKSYEERIMSIFFKALTLLTVRLGLLSYALGLLVDDMPTNGGKAAIALLNLVYCAAGLAQTEQFLKSWEKNDCLEREKEADLQAVKTLKTADGGVSYFKRSCDHNKRILQEMFEKRKKFEDEIKQFEKKLIELEAGGPTLQKSFEKFFLLADMRSFQKLLRFEDALITIAKLSIDEQGNNLLDKQHPPYTERIAYISSACLPCGKI